MIAMQEELFTLKEVAQRLKVSTFTVRRFIDQGELEAVRVGDRWRVRSGALERYITTNTMKSDKKK